MKTQHTEGEWIISVNDYEEFEVVLDDSEFGTCIIASIEDQQEKEANAKLIAAAPELLEALKDILDFSKDDLKAWANYKTHTRITLHGGDLIKALTAIEKATI